MTTRSSPRPWRVGTYMTSGEKADVVAAANRYEMSLAEFLRWVSLSVARAGRVPAHKPTETK